MPIMLTTATTEIKHKLHVSVEISLREAHWTVHVLLGATT